MLEKILANYGIKGTLVGYDANTTGNINKTFVVKFQEEDGSIKKYLVQKINTNVFPEPYKLMKNIDRVTTYLKKQMDKYDDKDHKVLEVIKTNNGKSLCSIENEQGTVEYYRMYDFIDNAISYDCSVDLEVVRNTGKAFGNFQKLLSGYPMNKLAETIPDFHNTPARYKKFLGDVKINPQGRVKEVAPEIVELLMRDEDYSLITDELEKGEIPYRVTHNDTKVNNVMMNKQTGDFLAVIDLDTVMPGSMLYDYGDGIRSTCSTALEDETDLSKVTIDLDLFRAYTDGYLSEMANDLTYEEVSLMGESVRIITLELAMRFLNDYINGDTYFKINYEKHNLDRARNQLHLAKEIEKNLDYMNDYVMRCYKKYNNSKKLTKKAK